jgi:pimeloyl-ACP methyl ester carboxylesterase
MRAIIDDVEIDYIDEGAGVPLIFIHAFPLNKRMWDDQVRELSRQCRVITIDLPGFGGSGLSTSPGSMERYADYVNGLMQILELERAVIIGLSMGGYVSLAFYRRYPNAVRALVLANTRATADTAEARQRRFDSAEKAEREGSGAIADDMIPLFFGPRTIAERPDLIHNVRAMAEANNPAGLAAAQRAMAGRSDSSGLITGIGFPALVIAGTEDRLSSLSDAAHMRNEISGSQLHIVQAAGHLSNLEQPADFNEALARFIGSLGE